MPSVVRSQAGRTWPDALLRGCEANAFDMVLTRDETRLAATWFEPPWLIGAYWSHGVRLHYYYSGEDVDLMTPPLGHGAARNFASELEREKTKPANSRHLKVERLGDGYVSSRKCFGYQHPVMNGDRRIRVEYPDQPGTSGSPSRIFQMYAEGEGLRAIVKRLNADRP